MKDSRAPRKRSPASWQIVALLALFVVAAVFALLARLLPGHLSGALGRARDLVARRLRRS